MKQNHNSCRWRHSSPHFSVFLSSVMVCRYFSVCPTRAMSCLMMCFSCQMLQSRFLSSILNGSEINATYGLPQHQQHQQQQGPMLGGPCGLDFRTMGSAVDTYLRRTTSAPITGLSGITSSMDTFGDDASQVTNLPFPSKLIEIGSLNGSFPYMLCDVMMC